MEDLTPVHLKLADGLKILSCAQDCVLARE
jgi:hypothetical protein